MNDEQPTAPMATLGVVGAGVMGAGITQIAARSGYDVVLIDLTDELLDEGLTQITRNLDSLVSKERLTSENRDQVLTRIEATTAMDRLADCEFIIESVVEDLETKCTVLRTIAENVDPEAIIATNTSSLMITELAHQITQPERVAGMHFFYPPTSMELVEVVPGRVTADETIALCIATAMQMGKKPIVVSDSTGFVVNRLLMPMINEAIFTLNEGVASAEEIDAAMRLGSGHQRGPLEAADVIGLDVVLTTMEALHRAFGDDKYRPAQLLRQMVASGQLGRKSGKGFYTYEPNNGTSL